MKQKPSLTYLSHEVCTFLGRIVRPTRNLAHASLKTAVHLSRRPFLMHALQGEEFFPPKRSSSAKGVCRGVEEAEYGRLLAGI